MPLDSAERNIQIFSNIGLLAIFKIVCNYDFALELGKIRYFALQSADGIGVVVVIKNRVRVCKDLCYLINGYAYHAFCGISIVIAERVMRNRPNKFTDVSYIIFDQKRAESL